MHTACRSVKGTVGDGCGSSCVERLDGGLMGVEKQPERGGIVLYQSPEGQVRLDVRLERDTVWLSLDQMAALFERDKSVISRHLRNVFASGELERQSVVAENATAAADGKTYQVDYFNLDAIISVGYRVNSRTGIQFRIWATATLRDHLLRGYTLNERRLRERGFDEIEQTVGLFGQEHGNQLGAIVGAVEQTFDGQTLYPSVQARAAHLLYFVIKA